MVTFPESIEDRLEIITGAYLNVIFESLESKEEYLEQRKTIIDNCSNPAMLAFSHPAVLRIFFKDVTEEYLTLLLFTMSNFDPTCFFVTAFAKEIDEQDLLIIKEFLLGLRMRVFHIPKKYK